MVEERSSLMRAYRFQARPTSKQQASLIAMLGDHCDLYNAALQERRDAYRHSSQTRVRYGDQSAQLTAIRKADPEGQGRWSFSSQQQTLRRLNRSFDGFFVRVKKGQKAGYPRFRSRARFDSVSFVNGDGAKWAAIPKTGSSTWTHAYLQGVGHIKVNQHRPVKGRVKQVQIKREGTRRRPRWVVIVVCDDVSAQPLPATGAVVGIDLATGENGLAWTSDGDKIDNLRPAAKHAPALAEAQRKAAASKPAPFKRATRRHRANLDRARKLHNKTARARLDYHHKVALDLVRDYDVIAVEAIQTSNMTRRAKAKPDPEQAGAFLPNGQAAKTGLNKSILDSGWSQFLSILHDKAACAGRTVIEVNPANTSRICHVCGNPDLDARKGKIYTCTNTKCGWVGDADINAARNILRAGLALLEPETEPA